jgi:anti-repressor protein
LIATGRAKPFSFAHNQIFKIMNELVYRKENQALTNSRLVAMKFGKRHSNVIRDIEELLSKLPENERKLNFELLEEDVEISNGGSKKLKFYAMTETGFTLLVMGFTGEKAIQFKLEYIAAFNKMKEIIKRSSLPSYQIEDPIKRAEKWIEEQKEKKALETKVEELSIENKEMEKRIEEDTPKVIFAMAVTESKRSCLVAELAKIICQNGMEIGQNRLFKWLRKKGYLGTKGEYYNQPMQRWVEAGMFEIKKRVITKPNGSTITVSTPMVTPAGQLHILNKFLEYYSKMQ